MCTETPDVGDTINASFGGITSVPSLVYLDSSKAWWFSNSYKLQNHLGSWLENQLFQEPP